MPQRSGPKDSVRSEMSGVRSGVDHERLESEMDTGMRANFPLQCQDVAGGKVQVHGARISDTQTVKIGDPYAGFKSAGSPGECPGAAQWRYQSHFSARAAQTPYGAAWIA